MFEVLTAHGENAKRWDEYVQHLSYDLRDVHVTSGWGRSQEAAYATAALAVWSNGWFRIIQPFLLREIWKNGETTGLYDMTAAGYGGPFSTHGILAPGDGDEFEAEFAFWRKRTGVVSEFYMLNPVTIRDQLPLIERTVLPRLVYERGVTIIPTGSDMDWGMAGNRTSSLKQATNAKIEIELVLDGFTGDYAEAMVRKEAAERWRISIAQFSRLFQDLGSHLLPLAAKDPEGVVRARALFLMGTGATAYYYLAARSGDGSGHGYPDALIVEAARQARYRGAAYLHLGGGLKDGDSLDAYKSSFGGLRRPVYSVRRIFDDKAYHALGGGYTGGFFPGYRAQEAQPS